jgi:hypothetical protein
LMGCGSPTTRLPSQAAEVLAFALSATCILPSNVVA